MEDIIKTVKSLEDSGLLLNGVTETVQNEVKKQKRGLLSILLGTLGASLLGNIVSGQEVNKKGHGINRASKGIVRVGYGHHSLRNKSNKMDF